MVIHWSWFRKEVVFSVRGQSTRNLGQYRGEDVVGIRRKRMPEFPCYDPIVQRKTQQQRTWKTVDSFRCHSRNNWDYFSNNWFFKSAQSLRSTRGNVWWIWIPSRKIWPTWYADRTVNGPQWNQGSSSCGRWRPAKQNFQLQRSEERIKSFTHRQSEYILYECKISKCCWSWTVFHDKDNGEQFYAKACRDYTLPRNEGSSQPKRWIQGNTKIGPVLEVATSCLYGKHGVEIRNWSLSEDNTQSWFRISSGSNKYVIDSNKNTESLADPHEEQAT